MRTTLIRQHGISPPRLLGSMGYPPPIKWLAAAAATVVAALIMEDLFLHGASLASFHECATVTLYITTTVVVTPYITTTVVVREGLPGAHQTCIY